MQQEIERAKIQGQIELEKAKQEYQAQENQLNSSLRTNATVREVNGTPA